MLKVALRKESVDRNAMQIVVVIMYALSLSARRAWIEIALLELIPLTDPVALRKESVDRNATIITICIAPRRSLSARRAWIEIMLNA